MVHKFIEYKELADAGYRSVRVGTTIVSFCEVCQLQRTHTCNGEKDGLYRFVCNCCAEKLRTPKY